MTTGKADNRVVSFIESLRGRRIGIVGAGVSHADLIRLLVEKGASVTLCDRKKSLEEFGPLGRELAGLGVQFRLGEGYLQNLTDFEIFFRTQGTLLQPARAHRRPPPGRGCDQRAGAVLPAVPLQDLRRHWQRRQDHHHLPHCRNAPAGGQNRPPGRQHRPGPSCPSSSRYSPATRRWWS